MCLPISFLVYLLGNLKHLATVLANFTKGKYKELEKESVITPDLIQFFKIYNCSWTSKIILKNVIADIISKVYLFLTLKSEWEENALKQK